MPARARLSAVFALLAVAAARPDLDTTRTTTRLHVKDSNHVKLVEKIPPPETKHVVYFPSNEVVKKGQILPSSDTEVNYVPFGEATGEATTEVVLSSPKAQSEPKHFSDNSRPVHQRFPHAVLFGATCGGTIIHPKWILTAGHCTLFTGGRYVLAGTNQSDDQSGVTKKVKALHLHPLFSVGPYWLNAKKFDIKQVAARHDFLLAELEEPLKLDGVTMAAATLETSPTTPPDTYVGYAGYGTDHHGGYMRSQMHAMKLQVQSDKNCSTLEQFNSEDMICARGYAPDRDSACNGDSGSGLVNGDGVLVGVTSWVQNDAFECAPGNIVVFSKVAAARNWIKQVSGV